MANFDLSLFGASVPQHAAGLIKDTVANNQYVAGYYKDDDEIEYLVAGLTVDQMKEAGITSINDLAGIHSRKNARSLEVIHFHNDVDRLAFFITPTLQQLLDTDPALKGLKDIDWSIFTISDVNSQTPQSGVLEAFVDFGQEIKVPYSRLNEFFEKVSQRGVDGVKSMLEEIYHMKASEGIDSKTASKLLQEETGDDATLSLENIKQLTPTEIAEYIAVHGHEPTPEDQINIAKKEDDSSLDDIPKNAKNWLTHDEAVKENEPEKEVETVDNQEIKSVESVEDVTPEPFEPVETPAAPENETYQVDSATDKLEDLISDLSNINDIDDAYLERLRDLAPQIDSLHITEDQLKDLDDRSAHEVYKALDRTRDEITGQVYRDTLDRAKKLDLSLDVQAATVNPVIKQQYTKLQTAIDDLKATANNDINDEEARLTSVFDDNFDAWWAHVQKDPRAYYDKALKPKKVSAPLAEFAKERSAQMENDARDLQNTYNQWLHQITTVTCEQDMREVNDDLGAKLIVAQNRLEDTISRESDHSQLRKMRSVIEEMQERQAEPVQEAPVYQQPATQPAPIPQTQTQSAPVEASQPELDADQQAALDEVNAVLDAQNVPPVQDTPVAPMQSAPVDTPEPASNDLDKLKASINQLTPAVPADADAPNLYDNTVTDDDIVDDDVVDDDVDDEIDDFVAEDEPTPKKKKRFSFGKKSK